MKFLTLLSVLFLWWVAWCEDSWKHVSEFPCPVESFWTTPSNSVHLRSHAGFLLLREKCFPVSNLPAHFPPHTLPSKLQALRRQLSCPNILFSCFLSLNPGFGSIFIGIMTKHNGGFNVMTEILNLVEDVGLPDTIRYSFVFLQNYLNSSLHRLNKGLETVLKGALLVWDLVTAGH